MLVRNPAFTNAGVYSDRWFTSNISGLALATRAAVTANIEAYPLMISRTTTFDKIGLDVQTLSAGNTCRVGIYTSNEKGYPLNLVSGSDVGTLSTTLVAKVNNTFAVPITLPPGLYFLANQCSATAPVLRSIATSGVSTVLGYQFTVGSTAAPLVVTGYQSTLTYAAFPNTFPKPITVQNTLTSTPIAVWLRPIG